MSPDNALERTGQHRVPKGGTFIHQALATLGIAVISVVLVSLLFHLTLIPRTFEPSGLPREIPALGRAYIELIAFVYGPVSSVVAKAFDQLPWMGLLVSFASITTAVTIQNLILWFGGKWLLARWRANGSETH